MEDRVNRWKELVEVQEDPSFSIETTLDTSFQGQIVKDVKRTRTGSISALEKSRLEMMLTYYCKTHELSYKQGMHELMVPFTLLSRHNIPESTSYKLFEGFISQIYPTMFKDTTFRPLNGLFQVFRLLLVYHCPSISNFLNDREISVEVFTASWFITLFASKIEEDELLLDFWEDILLEKDAFFPCYVCVALLETAKSYYLAEQVDSITATHIFSSIKFSGQPHITRVLALAREYKKNMPYSAKIRLKKYNVFNLSVVDSLVATLTKEKCLGILEREILQRTYPAERFCKCVNQTCEWCEQTADCVPLIVLDCRTPQEQKGGVISNSALIEPQAHTDPRLIDEIPDLYLNVRGVFHIALLGSGHTESKANLVVDRLIDAFIRKGFKFISTIRGGYESCHEFMIQYNLPMTTHNPEICTLCRPARPKLSNVIKKHAAKLKQFFSPKSPKTPLLVNEYPVRQFLCWTYNEITNSINAEAQLIIFEDRVCLQTTDESWEVTRGQIKSVEPVNNTELELKVFLTARNSYLKFQTGEDTQVALSFLLELCK